MNDCSYYQRDLALCEVSFVDLILKTLLTLRFNYSIVYISRISHLDMDIISWNVLRCPSGSGSFYFIVSFRILDMISAYDMMSLISEWLLSGRRRVLE